MFRMIEFTSSHSVLNCNSKKVLNLKLTKYNNLLMKS